MQLGLSLPTIDRFRGDLPIELHQMAAIRVQLITGSIHGLITPYGERTKAYHHSDG